MVEFISNLIKNDILATIIMSAVPMIELKGGIVFAQGVGLDFFSALGLAYLGSTFVFFPIFFLLIPMLNLLKKIKFVNKFAVKIENYIGDKAQNAVEKNKNKGKDGVFYKALGVFIFVAIPLPLTGVWMGTAIAVFLNLKFKNAVLPVAVGNLIAGLIISLLALFCTWAFGTVAVLDYILYGLFALALILLIVTIIKLVTTKKKNNQSSDKEKSASGASQE